MTDKRKYIIWGSAGHARVLADMLEQQHAELTALFDNDPEAQSISKQSPLYIGEAGFARWIASVNPAHYHGLVAIGGARGSDRIALQALFRRHGIQIAALIHESAFVASSAMIGAGTQLLAHSLVAAGASIGEACILNHKASVDHECIIGDGVHLAPGATLCGCVEIGDSVLVGAESCVLPRVKIGSNTIIGAGSLVTRDLPANVVAYGRPAKVVKPNN